MKLNSYVHAEAMIEVTENSSPLTSSKQSFVVHNCICLTIKMKFDHALSIYKNDTEVLAQTILGTNFITT